MDALHRLPLNDPWEISSAPLVAGYHPGAFTASQTIPACSHLQVALYPENPYWGEQVRRVNDQAWLYRYTFQIPTTTFRRARLHFEGVDYYASVWLNDVPIGSHEGHFAPFTFDVTQAIRRDAPNTLIVEVRAPWDTPNRRGTYPINHVIRGLVKGLYEHSEGVIPPDVNPLGIWAPVSLLLDGGVSLDKVSIRTALDGTVQLAVNTTNATDQLWTGTLILAAVGENHDGPGVDQTVPLELAPGSHQLSCTLHISDPHWWWPWDHGDPALYRLSATLQESAGSTVCSHSEVFGIRTVTLDRNPDRFTYRINGRPVFLRGTSYMPGLYLSLCDADLLTRDVELARRANLNLLRIHVHVSRPELYELCDRAGMLIWQDFELNWIQQSSLEFERRARQMQADMIALLENHPSVITWCCHNEPTMIFTHRENLEQHPDPALYADATQLDPTRPVFLCSGQMETDWRRSGDMHSYYGALWSIRYTDIYRHRFNLNTEFGFEAPAALETLRSALEVWERLCHLDGQIEGLWHYQAELIQFQVEHLRRLRSECSAGYIHFWLSDLVPQVGCGVLDSARRPKGGYEALRTASAPLQIALEHDGKEPQAIWIFNDTCVSHSRVTATWIIHGGEDRIVWEGHTLAEVKPNDVCWVADADWPVKPEECARIVLNLHSADGTLLATNCYQHPFQPTARPKGYPWNFDPILGVKVFNRPSAANLADLGLNKVFRLIPLSWREPLGEWVLRQRIPPKILSIIARVAHYVTG